MIQDVIVAELTKSRCYVSTAESCTGGRIAAALIDPSGASAVYQEGYITYSNAAKEKLLGVSKKTLDTYGAVSPQTAAEMAAGCARAAGSDYAIVSTGIAGPLGGTKDKPVGLVYLGCYARGTVSVYRNVFTGDRSRIRDKAVQRALEILLRWIQNR
jgi:PncC family amidohydrolase